MDQSDWETPDGEHNQFMVEVSDHYQYKGQFEASASYILENLEEMFSLY